MLVRLACAATALSFLAAGCGPAKLNQVRNYSIDPENVEGFYLPKQAKPQKVTIDFKSDEEVTVLLFKAEDATDETVATVAESKALGHRTGKGETFVVDVPENVETRFVVRAGKGKKAKVDVKVTN